MLAWPYYEYRKKYNDPTARTIGDFMYFIEDVYGHVYKNLIFFPFFGFVVFVLILAAGSIFIALENLYDKFIKNIKI